MSGKFYKEIFESMHEEVCKNVSKREMQDYIKNYRNGNIPMSDETLHKYYVYSEYLERNKK